MIKCLPYLMVLNLGMANSVLPVRVTSSACETACIFWWLGIVCVSHSSLGSQYLSFLCSIASLGQLCPLGFDRV